MDACVTAGDLLAGIDLTPMQVAQLRAVDHEHQQRLFALLHPPGAEPGRTPTPGERAELCRWLRSAVRGLLTPGQRARLEEREMEAAGPREEPGGVAGPAGAIHGPPSGTAPVPLTREDDLACSPRESRGRGPRAFPDGEAPRRRGPAG
jgi:hypothetical protein